MSWRSVYFLFSFSLMFGLANLTSKPDRPDCLVKVRDSDWEYDICSIVQGPTRTVEYKYSALAMSTQTVYEFNLGGLKEMSEVQCPKGTWICMSVYEHEDTEPPTFGGMGAKVWAFTPADSALGAITDLEGKSLTLRFRPNLRVHQPQQALIHFVCDSNAQEPTTPSLAGHRGGVHAFIWRTRHACGQNTANLTLSSAVTLLESEDTLAEEDEEGQDLRDAMPISSSSRRSTTIILLSGSIVIILGVFFYSSPTSVGNFIDSYVKPVRLRVGESRLMGWAEEDLILGGEEDVMVNSFDLEDEHIPLKPSPRRNFLVNYGSAR